MIWITMTTSTRAYGYGLSLCMSVVLVLAPTYVGAATGTSSQTDQESLAAFVGDFEFIGGEEQRRGVLDAIEVTVASIAAGVQDIARKRLRPPNEIPEHVRIAIDGKFSTVALDKRTIRTQMNGTKAAAWTNAKGRRVRVWHRLSGNRLVEKMVGVGGSRKNVYRLSADGSKLYLDVTMASPLLPRSVKYRLTYRRR